jgi:Ohr subfamily peroxiredoxin
MPTQEKQMRALYTAVATVRGGREGHAMTADGALDLNLVVPVEMGGPGGEGTNPEQLFAAGYAACFESAFLLAAKERGKPLRNANITACVTLNMGHAKDYRLSVELRGEAEGLQKGDIMDIMRAAHEICPYSKAIRNNVNVVLGVE